VEKDSPDILIQNANRKIAGPAPFQITTAVRRA
jgi:hypothetical protein